MHAYNETMLPEAMQNMGEMLEYSSRGCGLDPDKYLRIFCYSPIGNEWSKGNPVYICGRSGTELCMDVLEMAGCRYKAAEPDLLELGDLYWSGWILARYQWRTGEKLQQICQDVQLSDLLRLYPAGHTASEERACDLIDEFRQNCRKPQKSDPKSSSQIQMTQASCQAKTRLQAYRRQLGISQAELAQASGVNLRTLQEYEIGRKDLAQAAASKVIRLADILHVEPAELIKAVLQ